MRRFIVVGQRATTSGDFSLNDPCGGAGRLDVLLRCINSAFFLSHGLRTDVEMFLVLKGPADPPKTVRMLGSKILHLNPDERSTAAIIKNALSVRLPKGLEKEASEGVYISRTDLAGVLSLVGRENAVYLHERGEDVRGCKVDLKDKVFILGDDQGLLPEDESLLEGLPAISLGPQVLHADHCITLLHNELDRRT
jgi:tRNA (pseudouridine54-N1)-methyltransferase